MQVMRSDTRQAAYYVFNASQGRPGYVIIAGDDRVPAVLGYSETGRFDTQAIPEAMQELLDSYRDQMDALDQGACAASHLSGRPPIAPLVKAQWSQDAPYNILFPFIEGKHAMLGCAATVMAQIMYYWRWPARPTMKLPAYTSSSLSIYMPSLPVVDFDWDNMCDTYLTEDTTSVQAHAAALLSLYCAQSLETDFLSYGSAAYTTDIPKAFITYFGYNPNAYCIYRQRFTTDEWEQLLYNELTEKRPVVYSGNKASSGHAFICDGYDGNGLFHINWGWNGRYNGYFLLSILNPEAQGTGSASGSYGFIYSQVMVINLNPSSDASPQLQVADKYINVENYSSTRSSTNVNFSVTQTTHFLNESNEAISFDYAWGLYNENNELILVMNKGQKYNLPSWYYSSLSRTLYFGKGITSGTYRIIPIYSEPNTDNWKHCIGSNINYIEVVINGNNCSVTCHGESQAAAYEVNDVNITGHYHPGRPLNISLNVTNLGYTRNDLIYMFANNQFFATGYVDLEKGESGDVNFMYSSETTGTVVLKYCLDENGNNPIFSHSITIQEMPEASLSGNVNVLNVSDTANRVITSDKFGFEITIRNTGTNTYDEDVTAKLYKRIYGNNGTLVQTINQPLTLGSSQETTLLFNFDNVMDGWQYYIKTYYYSSGTATSLTGSNFYTIFIPDHGDVNGDGVVNIADVADTIDYILSGDEGFFNLYAADVNGDGVVNIADVADIIDYLLNGYWN